MSFFLPQSDHYLCSSRCVSCSFELKLTLVLLRRSKFINFNETLWYVIASAWQRQMLLERWWQLCYSTTALSSMCASVIACEYSNTFWICTARILLLCCTPVAIIVILVNNTNLLDMDQLRRLDFQQNLFVKIIIKNGFIPDSAGWGVHNDR